MRRAHREQLQLAEEMLEAKVRVRVCALLCVCIRRIAVLLTALPLSLDYWRPKSPVYSKVVGRVESMTRIRVGNDMNSCAFGDF